MGGENIAGWNMHTPLPRAERKMFRAVSLARAELMRRRARWRRGECCSGEGQLCARGGSEETNYVRGRGGRGQLCARAPGAERGRGRMRAVTMDNCARKALCVRDAGAGGRGGDKLRAQARWGGRGGGLDCACGRGPHSRALARAGAPGGREGPSSSNCVMQA